MKIITDTFGNPTGPTQEPDLGSVVLVGGPTGAAWQRQHSTGKWHSTDDRVRPWRSLLKRRNLVLAYEAPAREEEEVHS